MAPHTRIAVLGKGFVWDIPPRVRSVRGRDVIGLIGREVGRVKATRSSSESARAWIAVSGGWVETTQ